MARRGRGADVTGEDDGPGGGLALDTADHPDPDAELGTGPYDGDDLDPEITDAVGMVDFGSVRVPVPARGTVTVEPTAKGRMQAVHITLPEGRLSVSALAAPKSSKLWPQLAREIDASLRDGGARVRSFQGEWGRELHATSGGATSVFVGVDGPRWMVYGVATGASRHADTLDADLRRMLRGTVVVRGKAPYPVRTILPLTVPDHLAQEATAGTADATGPGTGKVGKTSRTSKTAKAGQAGRSGRTDRTAEPAAAIGAANATVATGPAPDAPLREQAPSVRRAVAASWRSGPTADELDPEPYPTQGDDRTPLGPPPTPPPPTEALRMVPPPPDAQRAMPPRTEAPRPVPPVQAPPTEALRVVAPPRAAPPAVPPMVPPTAPPTQAFPTAPPPTEVLRTVAPGSGGRRRLREPDAGPAPTAPGSGGRGRLSEPDPARLPPPAERGGRRRLREPQDELPTGRRPDPAGSDGGRRRLREPDLAASHDPVGPPVRRRPPEPDPLAGIDGGGRRRLRESGPAADTTAQVPTGRRYLREPVGEPLDGGGRRRLREPTEAAATPPDSRWDLGASPGGGRRHVREPAVRPPGAPTEPWSLGGEELGGLGVDRTLASEGWRRELGERASAGDEPGRRRTVGAEYLIETGEQVWSTGPDAPAPPPPARRQGRHAAPEEGEDAPRTIPLRTLLGDAPFGGRPGGRHHRRDESGR